MPVRGLYESLLTLDLQAVLEVGWLAVREGQISERLEWAGVEFAYLRTWEDAEGQRFVRSAPLRWEP